MTEPAATGPRCAHCGQPIAPGRAPGTWRHRSRTVAACDLDSDHRPEPAAPPGPAPQAAPPGPSPA